MDWCPTINTAMVLEFDLFCSQNRIQGKHGRIWKVNGGCVHLHYI